MADVSNRSRKPRGAPNNAGGQFSTENRIDAAVVLDTGTGSEPIAVIVGEDTEITKAATTLADLMKQQSAAPNGSDVLYTCEGRSMAFSEYVAILHDPDLLDDPHRDRAVGQAATDARDAVRAGFDLAAPSELDEKQRHAAIEFFSAGIARECAYAAESAAAPQDQRPGTRAEEQHGTGRLNGYGAALVELVHSGQPSMARIETNTKLADLTDAWSEQPTAAGVAALASSQRTEHRIIVAEQVAAAAYDDVIGADQDLVEAERYLDLVYAADPNWDRHGAAEEDISHARLEQQEAQRVYKTAMGNLDLARAPQVVQEIDDDLAGARDVANLRSRDSIELELARFRGHQDRVNSALAAGGAGTDPAHVRLQRAARLVTARVALLDDRFNEWRLDEFLREA